MRVSDIQVIDVDDACQLQAQIVSDRDAGDAKHFAPFTLWYRFPAWCRPFLRPDNGDPFLAALLVPAMMMGESLVIPGTISARLLRSLPDIQSIYRSFDPRLHPITVDTLPRQVSSPRQRTAIGLFFSLGVDSFYSLLKNLQFHPGDDETVSHLVMLHGFDVTYGEWDERFPERMLSNGERVARESGKTLLPVITNLHLAARPLSRWSLSHGSALISVALALDGFFDQILIAATTTYDQLYPWGSHPVLDPRWSTGDMTVVHDGCEMGRIDKIRRIAASDLALDTLKVCPHYNCGKCIKCLPTIIDLMQAGALENCSTLPHDVDVGRLREIFRVYKGELNVENYQRRLANLEDTDQHADLRAVLEEFLAGEEAAPIAPRTRQSAMDAWLQKVLPKSKR